MNADQLLAHYERIADAPDAIMRLRRFILDLAVLGKLVEQDPNDEPAAILLAGGKRCKPQKPRHADTPGWLVFPVGALLEFRYGKGKKASERINEGPVPVFGSNGIVGYCETPLTEAPSIIVGRKGSAGALNLCNGSSWTTDVAYFVEAPNFFDLRYLLIGLQALHLEPLGKGVKPGLSRSDVYDLPLSVPPLAEQHRIVDKVDELMVLCDRLEEARTEREETRDRLSVASLARLNAPDPDQAVFQNHAAFALDNLIPLTTCPDQIKALRQTILNLAVRGKLVEQDPNDEPASELLKQIAAVKARLVKTKKINKQAPFLPPDLSEVSFDLPGSWAWCPSTYPSCIVSDKGKKIQTKDIAEIGEFPVVDQGKVLIRGYHNDANKVIRIKAPIVLFGDHTREVKLIDFDFVVGADGVKLLQPVSLHTPYYFLALRWLPLKSRGYGRHFKLLKASFIPLPPLAEQPRIVAKVDELMALCDRLEASLTAADTIRWRLLDALLHEALAPSEEESGSIISTIAQKSAGQTARATQSADRVNTDSYVN